MRGCFEVWVFCHFQQNCKFCSENKTSWLGGELACPLPPCDRQRNNTQLLVVVLGAQQSLCFGRKSKRKPWVGLPSSQKLLVKRFCDVVNEDQSPSGVVSISKVG